MHIQQEQIDLLKVLLTSNAYDSLTPEQQSRILERVEAVMVAAMNKLIRDFEEKETA